MTRLSFDNNTINRFREEKIDRQTVKELSDLQLDNLGIKTIGDKIRLREECSSKVAGETRQQRLLNISTGNNRISYGRSGSMGSLAQAVSERNNLFSTTARYSLPSSTSTSRRRARSSATTNKEKPRPWTANFVCLANKYSVEVPPGEEKSALHRAGLGYKKIKLNMNDNETAVLEKICDGTLDHSDEQNRALGFPQLRDCGGFELMTCKANSRDLSVLNCSFTASNIKSKIGGGQGKIYIRPIQRNIELKDSVGIDVSKLKQKCFTCGEEVLIKDLRKHVYSYEPLNLLSDDFSLPDPFGQSVSEGNTLRNNEKFPANNANDTTTRDLHLNTSENNENSNQDQVQSQTN